MFYLNLVSYFFKGWSYILKAIDMLIEFIKKYPKYSAIIFLSIILIFIYIANNNLKEDIKEKDEIIEINDENYKKLNNEIIIKNKINNIEEENILIFKNNIKDNLNKINNLKNNEKITIKIK